MKINFPKDVKKLIITGLLCIFSEIIFSVSLFAFLGAAVKAHRSIIESNSRNLKNMSSISELIHLEHNAVCNFVISTDEGQMNVFERFEIEERNRLSSALNSFRNDVKGTDAEQDFHKIYVECTENFKRIEIAMEIKRNGGILTASQYITRNLSGFKYDFNQNISRLENFFNEKLEKSVEDLNHSLFIYKLVIPFNVIIIIFSAASLFAACFILSSRLGHLKKNEEEEIERRSREISRNEIKLSKSRDITIKALFDLIGNKNGDAGINTGKINQYVTLLAQKSAENFLYKDVLNERYIELLGRAAEFHDIGMLRIPENIIKKPGRLTKEEYELVKTHAEEGEKIVKDIYRNSGEDDFILIAGGMAGSHHERWNGEGYPLGLKEKDIPLSARIMAIVDVFNALVSPRCYKQPVTPEAAFQIIQDGAGLQFDPDLVKVWCDNEKEIIKILES